MGDVVLLFDGVCNLCDAAVQLVHRNEPSGRVRVASLQSRLGQALLAEAGHGDHGLRSFVLVEGERLWFGADAALRLCRYLRPPWPLLQVGWVLPGPVRRALYDFVARNRYRWFGRKGVCALPTPSLRARFLLPELAEPGPIGAAGGSGALLQRAERRAYAGLPPPGEGEAEGAASAAQEGSGEVTPSI